MGKVVKRRTRERGVLGGGNRRTREWRGDSGDQDEDEDARVSQPRAVPGSVSRAISPASYSHRYKRAESRRPPSCERCWSLWLGDPEPVAIRRDAETRRGEGRGETRRDEGDPQR